MTLDDLVLWLLVTLAAYRVWRAIGRDDVSERLRDVLSAPLRDPVECPWCLGFWVTLATFAVADVVVGLRLPVLQAVAGSAVVGLIGSRVDVFPIEELEDDAEIDE